MERAERLARLLPVREGPDMNVLTMQDVRKSFGSLEVLKGISLTVGEGEAVSVIGPSGSGKSTLLRCATLLETMDGGSLAYGNDFAATMDAEGKSVYADKAALRRIKKPLRAGVPAVQPFPALHGAQKRDGCAAHRAEARARRGA